jgi:ribosomal protein L29
MINNIIDVKCKCGEIIKINVKSITQLQEKVKRLENELSKLKQENSLDYLKNMFGM